MTGQLTSLAADSAADALEGADRQRLAALYRQRAERLASPPDLLERRGTAVLSARVGPGLVSVRLTQLAEVMPLARWSPVPGWPPALLGVVSRRGTPLPVVDLHHLLGHAEPPPGSAYLMLARCPGGLYGLRVEVLGEIQHIETGALAPPAAHPGGGRAGPSIVEGIGPDGLVLIDPGRLTAAGGPLERAGPF